MGDLVPVVAIVTDNVGPFRSFTFEAFMTPTPSCATSAPGCARPGKTAHANVASGAEVRVALPPPHRRRDRLDRPDRCLQRRLRPNPAPGRPPGPGRPHQPHLRSRRKPANYLTRNTLRSHNGCPTGAPRRGSQHGQLSRWRVGRSAHGRCGCKAASMHRDRRIGTSAHGLRVRANHRQTSQRAPCSLPDEAELSPRSVARARRRDLYVATPFLTPWHPAIPRPTSLSSTSTPKPAVKVHNSENTETW